MREYQHPSAAPAESRPQPAAGAPGKRTLTQSLHPRLTASFDPSGQYTEGRATVDPPTAAPAGTDPGGLLSDAQLRQARRKNPRYQRSLGFDPATYSSAPVDSDAFALDVANLQAHSLLAVDGIVGPATAAAVGNNHPPQKARARPRAHPSHASHAQLHAAPSAAHIDSDADLDDPFALHLLED